MTNIRPARCTFDGENLISQDFSDVYFSGADGPAESEYVFIDGNYLKTRWLGFSGEFTIIETGFGSGLNFLLAAELFLKTASEKSKLNFISFEKYPIEQNLLKKIYSHWGFAKNIQNELLAKYPPLETGWQKVSLAEGRITLEIFFGDISEGIAQLTTTANCWFLDGFAPDKNEAMWTGKVFDAMEKYSTAHTTLATFTAAGKIKKALRDRGFFIKRRDGFGRKWHMIVGRFLPGGKK